ncbi:MAG: putative metalloprotease CJM1_0395 family protein [Gemmatimonadales bacterium]
MTSPFERYRDFLQGIDAGIRQHEQAHQLAGSGVTGAASYRYVRGPDGRYYIVAGRVNASIQPGLSPEETADAARKVRNAALAPGDPSSEDQSAAGAAAAVAVRAEGEITARERARREAGGAPLDGVAAELFQLAAAFEAGSLSFSRIDTRA